MTRPRARYPRNDGDYQLAESFRIRSLRRMGSQRLDTISAPRGTASISKSNAGAAAGECDRRARAIDRV